jgi:polysaccharide deacetylase 2 family uncharacterized protein YibQ
MSNPADLKLKPRRVATAQSAAGAYGAMQARSVPGQTISQAAASAPLPRARGFFSVNWPLMTAAAALLAGGVAMGMAVGNAPRPQPTAIAAVSPLLQPAKEPAAAPVASAATTEPGWRPISELTRQAALPPLPIPVEPPKTEPPPVEPVAVVELPKSEPQPEPTVAAPVTVPAARVTAPPAPAPAAMKKSVAREAPVQLAAAPSPPPSLAPRNPGEAPAWRARAVAPPATAKPPFVAFLIDDAGLDRRGTQRATRLQAPVTLSFMSYAADLSEQSAAARAAGHEVMLHLPMEPLDAKRNNPGPQALYVGLDEAELQRRLTWHLDRFSDYVGVNNHMGSRFTANAAGMSIVLNELSRRQVFWLDSLSGPSSAGPALARKRGLDAAERDLFLDDERSPGIAHELAAMERIARTRGDVIVIGHPHASTLAAIETWMVTAKERGFSLVPVSAVLLRRQQQER